MVSPRIGNVLSGTCHDQETLLHGNQDHRRACTIRPRIAEGSLAEAGRDNLGICQQHRPFPALAQSTPNKGYGNSTTMPFDVTDVETANRVLLALSETAGNRLRSDDVKIQVVSVGIRYFDLSYFSHQRILDTPTDLTMEIYNAAKGLFLELWNGRCIRHLGVHTRKARRDEPGRQMNLFDEVDYKKLTVMDRTVDALWERFGIDSIKRAVFLNQPVDHMSDGISNATGLR